MESSVQRLSLLRPVRLRLEIPLEGPYTRVLRRPSPEVEALGRGKCLAIVRATSMREAVPLLPARVACYFGSRGRGLQAEDFQEVEWASRIIEERSKEVELRFLAVPVGHVRLPNEMWVSRLAAVLTPWREEAVEGWRSRVKRSIWLSVLRLYEFDGIAINRPAPAGLHLRVQPFRAANLRPVLADQDFAEALDRLLETVEKHQDRKTSRFARRTEGSMQEESGERRADYPLEEMAAETGFEVEKLREWEGRLRRKKQVILYGPPGTGKTFLAERMARRLTEGTGGFGELVQFHPSYAYEDFVQGIRPDTENGTVAYRMVPGRFLDFCRRAEEVESALCVLVIDEINRAHLSRVFGELMYLLEYRDRAIPLAGGGETFRIPKNVHLIGTMNTADRSIALVDQALRRRFAFIRLRPDYEVLTRFLKEGGYPADSLVTLLRDVNRSIGDADSELGISFFMKEGEDLRRTLSQIWIGEIEPYLEEVFYDRPEQVDNFRWPTLVADRLEEWG